MLNKESLKKRESVFLDPFEEEAKYFMISLNQCIRYEIL